MVSDEFDVEAVLAENARVRADLLSTLARVPEPKRDALALGEWRLRDVVAHLAGAQSGYAEALEHAAKGEPPTISDYGPPGPPHDWNSRVVARSAGRSWDDLLADLDAARVRHEAAVRGCRAMLPGHEQARFFARNVARHEGGHLEAIKRWLGEEDPLMPALLEVIAENQRVRADLLAALDALPDSRRREGWFGDERWSLYDIIAHLYSWQNGFAHALERIARGERPEVPDYEPNREDADDAYNARAVAANRHLAWEDLMAHLRAARERHEAAVKNLAGHLAPERFEPGKTARRLANSAEHDREHVPAILEWRRREGS